MAICSCGSPARCCQPAVAGGFIYADLRGELSTHLAPQALFARSSPGRKPLLQAFPFPSALGEVTLHQLSQACVFIESSRGKWSSLLSCGVFLPQLLLQAFLLLVARRVLPLLPSPASLFIYSSVRGCSSPAFCTQGALPSLLPVFFVVTTYYSGFFFFFSLGGGLVCPGGCADLAQGCLWEYRVLLSSPCGLCLPQPSGPWRLVAAWELSWFLCFNMKWRCSAQAGGVEESKFCLFSVVFPVRCISIVSPRIYCRKPAFCFLPLAAILESLYGYFNTLSYSC
jgi:hypothetical protein